MNFLFLFGPNKNQSVARLCDKLSVASVSQTCVHVCRGSVVPLMLSDSTISAARLFNGLCRVFTGAAAAFLTAADTVGEMEPLPVTTSCSVKMLSFILSFCVCEPVCGNPAWSCDPAWSIQRLNWVQWRGEVHAGVACTAVSPFDFVAQKLEVEVTFPFLFLSF